MSQFNKKRPFVLENVGQNEQRVGDTESATDVIENKLLSNAFEEAFGTESLSYVRKSLIMLKKLYWRRRTTDHDIC